MQAAHHVGGPGAEGILIAAAHQGLGGQVKHHLRLEGIQSLAQAIQIGEDDDFLAFQIFIAETASFDLGDADEIFERGVFSRLIRRECQL